MQSTIIYNQDLQNVLISLHSLDMSELTPSEMVALAKILQQKTEQLQDVYAVSQYDPYGGHQFDDTAW